MPTLTDANRLSPIQQAYIQKRRAKGQSPFVGSMDQLQQRAQTYDQNQQGRAAIAGQRARHSSYQEQIGAGGDSAYASKKKALLGIYNDPDLQAYNDSYGANFGAARSAVENAFSNAMGEINQRGAAAGGVLDQMPGNIQRIYGDAQAGMDQATTALGTAQQASGLSPLVPASSYMAPVQAANATDQAGRLAGVPLLRSGVEGALSKERQSANSDYQMALADIAEREASARSSGGGLNAVGQELLSEEAQNTADQSGGWGSGYLGTDRGGDIANKRPQFADMLRKQAGGVKAQSAYNDAMDEFSKARQKGLKLDSNHLHKIVEKLRKRHGKYMGALNLALIDAGYS